MIGHFLLTLSVEEEDRVLTQPMVRDGISAFNDTGCLVQVAWGNAIDLVNLDHPRLQPQAWEAGNLTTYKRWIPGCYDALCMRFGETRVNAAIRTRILANRAARALQEDICMTYV